MLWNTITRWSTRHKDKQERGSGAAPPFRVAASSREVSSSLSSYCLAATSEFRTRASPTVAAAAAAECGRGQRVRLHPIARCCWVAVTEAHVRSPWGSAVATKHGQTHLLLHGNTKVSMPVEVPGTGFMRAMCGDRDPVEPLSSRPPTFTSSVTPKSAETGCRRE